MTEANDHEIIDELQNMCECGICCNEYDNKGHIPRVLPCQHTFCTNCLLKQCKEEALKCPICNQEYRLDKGNVNRLPKDYTRRDLRELLDRFSRSFCKECQNHNLAQYICKVCNTRICHICYSQRKVRNVGNCIRHIFERQEVVSSTQNLFASKTGTLPTSVCVLTGHEKNELKYFCSEKSCHKPVCANCVVESHKEHATRTIADEYDERKKVLQSWCQATTKKIKNARLLLDNICKENESDMKALNNLKEQAIRGIKYINDFQMEAEKSFNERLQKCTKMLGRKQEQIRSFIENSSECCVISEEALSDKTMVAFLSVEKTLTEKHKQFAQSDVDKPFDAMRSSSDVELQAKTFELKSKIDQMTMKDGKTRDKNCSTKEKISTNREPPSCLHVFVSLSLTWFLSVWIVLYLCPLPYSHVFDVDHTRLALRQSPSSHICLSTDRRMVSSIPMEKMKQTCGNRKTPYIFGGAFTNRSLLYRKEEHFVFHFNVSKIKHYSPGLILFEFGVSKGAIERRNLRGPFSFNFYGWMLTVFDERKAVLINSEGRTLHTSPISLFDKPFYDYYIVFNSNRSIILKIKDKNGKKFKFLEETRSIRGKPKWGFAKLCPSNNAHVTVKMSEDGISFNKSTLYPTLYITADNITISNTPKYSFSRKQSQKKDHEFKDIMLQNCSRECVYVLQFRVEKPTVSNTFFSLILTNSEFLPSAHYNITLFTYARCLDTNLESFFCLIVNHGYKKHSIIPMAPDVWHSITIMINRARKFASFIVGNHEINVEDGYIFEKDTPILRSVILTLEDNISIYLADSDEFDILSWFNVRVSQIVKYILLCIPFPPVWAFIMLVCYLFYRKNNNQPVSADAERNAETYPNQERHQIPVTTSRRRRR